MIVGFTGTRRGITVAQDNSLRLLLSEFQSETNPSVLHHGACIGADRKAHNIARLTYRMNMWPSDTEQHSWACDHATIGDRIEIVRPPLLRNKCIVDATDVLIAVPHGAEILRSGTWATVRYSRKQQKRRYIIKPDGDIEREL